MITYTVHEPARPAQTIDERADQVVFVKEGFTWWGFLFGPFWLLFNALWFEFIAALLLSGGLAAGLVELGLKEQAPGIANLFLMLVIGFEGNDLRRWRLERKGYRFLCSVAGSSFEECERRFFDAWLPSLASGGAGKPPAKPTAGANLHSSGDWSGPGVIGTLPGEAL
ncbi:MAG: DUF2628 domain-containing protein [Rhodomicrobium sp.]|nr:DUF2628 domain-containing protein [Rhodomicrobium sp.]